MPAESLASHIHERLQRADASASADEVALLAAYVRLLATWNRRINLTAFALDQPSDEAVDRLIVEPVLAAQHIWSDNQTMIDLGSGGGSPAIPLKILQPRLRVVMVESRSRKAAFLREAVRSLGLARTTVENDRFEEVAQRAEIRGQADLVTFRAVRADHALWTAVTKYLTPSGRVFWFGAPSEGTADGPGLVALATHRLGPAESGRLAILGRAGVGRGDPEV